MRAVQRYARCIASGPDMKEIANLFKISYFKIENDDGIHDSVKTVLKTQGPVLCEVIMDIDFRPKPSLGTETRYDNLQPPLNK